MTTTYAAGAVVVGDKGHVLVVNQNGNSWSLPKGHIDPGETEEQAAIRETAEESGITGLSVVKKLGTYQRYRIGLYDDDEDKSELKHITMFLCRATEASPQPLDIHNPEAKWVTPDEVPGLLTHPKDKAFFETVLAEVESLTDSPFTE